MRPAPIPRLCSALWFWRRIRPQVEWDGQNLRYATYLGGTGDESADALLSDNQGGGLGRWDDDIARLSRHLERASAQFGRWRGRLLAHLDHRGRLLFSTYLGGSGNDAITAIDRLDGDRIVLVGNTSSVRRARRARSRRRGWFCGRLRWPNERHDVVSTSGGRRDDHLKAGRDTSRWRHCRW